MKYCIQLTDWDNPLISEAFSQPSLYCLKILREAGHLGNIFEEDDVLETLKKMEHDKALRTEYCLMRMIKSDVLPNTIGI